MTEHQDDIDIDRNLKILFASKSKEEFDMTNFTNKHGRQMHSSNESKKFAKLMIREGLIRVFGDFCALEKFGFEVCKNGGWLKHLSDQEKEETELELKTQEKENLELENLKLQKEAAEHKKSRRDLESQIQNLTRDNLRLGNWDIRFRWYIAIAGFIIGIITKYFIDK